MSRKAAPSRDWATGGVMSRYWSERHSRPTWPAELERMIACASANYYGSGRVLDSGVLSILEAERAQLSGLWPRPRR
jgi:hypothetical protein